MQDHIKTSHPEFDMIHILQMFGVPHNWKCSTCKQTFYTEKEQRMHQCGKPHPSWLGIPTDSTFTCEHCGDHIQKYLNYLFHVILHHFPEELNKIKNINLDKESLKQCKKCDYTTLETARFKTHMFEVHVGKVKCDQCKRKFHSLQALQNHQKILALSANRQAKLCDVPNFWPYLLLQAVGVCAVRKFFYFFILQPPNVSKATLERFEFLLVFCTIYTMCNI